MIKERRYYFRKSVDSESVLCYNKARVKRQIMFPIYIYPPVAKLDIAADSDSEGRGFESLRAGQICVVTHTGCILLSPGPGGLNLKGFRRRELHRWINQQMEVPRARAFSRGFSGSVNFVAAGQANGRCQQRRRTWLCIPYWRMEWKPALVIRTTK